MLKNNKLIISKLLLVPILAFGTISNANIISANAAEIEQAQQVAKEENTLTLNQVKEEFNLKSINKAPKDAKILKFTSPEEAKEFLTILQENDDKILDLSSLVSDSEINENQIIDLSHKDISNDNFKEINIKEDNEQLNVKSNIKNSTIVTSAKSEGFDTAREASGSVNGLARLNAVCTMHISWSNDLGNHISSVKNVTTTFTGVTYGNAWSQSDYVANISKDGKSVRATVYGKFDYYILIDTSLTQLAGKKATINFNFKY